MLLLATHGPTVFPRSGDGEGDLALALSVDPSIVPAMIDAVLEQDAADPAVATTVDAAVRTTLGAEQGAGLLPG